MCLVVFIARKIQLTSIDQSDNSSGSDVKIDVSVFSEEK